MKSPTTASGTRHRVKENGGALLPYTIITNFEKLLPSDQPNTTSTLSSSTEEESVIQTTTTTLHTEPRTESSSRATTNGNPNINSMADSVLLARARKARYDDLPNFSGYPSEDAERFLKSVKNMTKANDDSTDPLFLEIVRGKLTQTAGSWFDDNELQFTKWSDFETAFRNRYFSTTMVSAKFDKLSQRKQRYDESVTGYFDEIITLCREVDPKMPDTIIIQHLMKGINPEFRKELTRRQSTMSTLPEFLKFAKLEQDLHDTFTQLQETTTQPEPYATYHLSSQVNQLALRNNSKYQRQNHAPLNQNFPPMATRSFDGNRNSYSNSRRGATMNKQNFSNSKETTLKRNQQTNYSLCKVCGKQNHRSIDYIHKRSSGCYNCGQQHSVRDCLDPPHFQ